MCNLYRTRHSAAEIADLFRARLEANSNAPEEIYPGYPGLVVVGAKVRSMIWGFPLALRGKSGQALKPKPVNNARSDNLDNFMWRYSFEARRCLIPVSEFAEAEGKEGSKTRTWISLPDQPLFAIAGIWKDSPEWGPVYSMVMTDASSAVVDVHNRMPVILRPEDWKQWTDGSAFDARKLCVPYTGGIVINRTADPWRRRQGALN